MPLAALGIPTRLQGGGDPASDVNVIVAKLNEIATAVGVARIDVPVRAAGSGTRDLFRQDMNLLLAKVDALAARLTVPTTGLTAWAVGYPLGEEHARLNAIVAKVDQLAAAVPSRRVAGPRVHGISVAGGSFGDHRLTAEAPGTYGTDWFYEVDGSRRTNPATFTYLKARGHQSVRIDFRWERVQPTLDGPLDLTEVRRLRAMLDAVHAAGLTAILDCHNYGHYKKAGAPGLASAQGGWSLGEPALPYTAFADFWRRMVGEFQHHPAVWGWEIMNEPVSMASTGSTVYTAVQTVAATGTGAGPDRTTGATAGSLDLSRTGTGQTGLGGAGIDLTGRTHAGVWVRVGVGSDVTTIKLEVQLADYSYSPITGDVVVPPTGGWVQLTGPLPAPAQGPGSGAAHRQFAVFVGGGAGAKTIHVDDLTVGTSSGSTVSGRQHWRNASQHAVAAIRAAETPGQHRPVLVGGYNWSKVQGWAATNGEPWIDDPLGDPDRLVYVGHHYWDDGQESAYGADSPASVYGSTAAARTQIVDTDLAAFTRWGATHGVRLAITEFGWPDNAWVGEWNTVGSAYLRACSAAGVHTWYWSAGSIWGGYELAAYEAAGATWHDAGVVNADNGQAAVLHADT